MHMICPKRIKSKLIPYKQAFPSCPTVQLWEAQNKYTFVFVPLGDQVVPNYIRPVDLNTDPITLHRIISDSDQYNFLQSQINLRS